MIEFLPAVASLVTTLGTVWMFRRWEDDGFPGRRDPSSPDAADPEK